MLETEENPIVFDKLSKDPYTRNSINKLRSSCDVIANSISKIAFRRAFEHMHLKKLKPVSLRDRFSEVERRSVPVQKAI